jgi:tetratricopeptide (TPR) repeat protein
MADAGSKTRLGALALAAALLGVGGAVASAPARGVVVERVRPALLGAAAGVRTGDVLLAWSRPQTKAGEPPVGGSFETPFDVVWVETEEAPRGPVRVVALRGDRELSLTMPIWRWGISARPDLSPLEVRTLEEARTCFDEKVPDLGWSRMVDLAERSVARKEYGNAAWLFASAGEWLAGAGRPEGAEEAFWRASLEAEKEPGAKGVAAVWIAAGSAFAEQEGFGTARECYTRALAILRQAAGSELLTAKVLGDRAAVLWSLGKLDESLRDDRESLSLRRAVVPGSVLVAASLNNVGLSLRSLGDLSGAQAHYEEALTLFEREMPGSAVHATILGNLGTVAWMRGDLASAEAYDLKALEIREKVAPESFELARSWTNLGTLARSRRDPDTAERYYKKALDLAEKLKPESLETGAILNNLSQVADDRGDLDGALDYAARALAMQMKAAPRSVETAKTLTSMASFHLGKGDMEASRRCNEEALVLKEQEALGSLSSTWNYMILGQIAERRKDYGAADAAYSTALEIRRKVVPGSAEESEALYELGNLHILRGEPDEAEAYFERALEALEGQRGKLGGGEEVARGFSAHFADYYRDLAALQVRRGEFDRAFLTLERFRAKSLLTMLAERDLDLGRDAPADLLAAVRRADHDYDKVQGELAGLSPEKDASRIAQLSERLAELRALRGRIAEEVRRSSPRLGSLRYPVPLDRAGAGRALPKGCLLLSFCTGADEVLVLALLDGRLEGYRVSWERARLKMDVGMFRKLVSDPAGDSDELRRRGPALFEVRGTLPRWTAPRPPVGGTPAWPALRRGGEGALQGPLGDGVRRNRPAVISRGRSPGGDRGLR